MTFDIRMFDAYKSIVIVESVGYESVLKHRHSFVEIVYVNSGEASHWVDGKTSRIKAGDLFVIADDSEHCIIPVNNDEDFKITNILCVYGLLEKENFPSPLEVFAFESLPRTIDEIKTEYYAGQSNEKILLLLIKNLINRCLIEKERVKSGRVKSVKRKKSAEDYINSAVRFIHDSYYKNIKVSDVAAAVGLYPSYLEKVFVKYRATSIYNYLIHYRMERACKFLTETDFSVEEISHMVGINDVKNFYITFKRFFNETPKKYRESRKNGSGSDDGYYIRP